MRQTILNFRKLLFFKKVKVLVVANVSRKMEILGISMKSYVKWYQKLQNKQVTDSFRNLANCYPITTLFELKNF